MARVVRGRESSYYIDLVGDTKEEQEQLVVSGELEDGVYSVERVVEMRKRKVCSTELFRHSLLWVQR